jgi:ferredoxin-NADP reductase
MAIYKVKLKGRREIASGTMAFHFEKPVGFSYKAGQFGDLTLANPPESDAEGNTRGFSLASAPYDAITTSNRQAPQSLCKDHLLRGQTHW